jgi:hypothetical protein
MIISFNPRNSMMLLSTLGEMLAMSDMKKEEVAEQVSPEAMNKLCSNETTVGYNLIVLLMMVREKARPG